MIELSNSTVQTIPVGGAVTFDTVLLKRGCDTCFNNLLPTSVKLTNRNFVYDVEFQGNIATNTAATPVQLSIAIAGQPIATTEMDATPAAVGDYWNVSSGTYISNCCDDLDRISIINSGTNPVVLKANSLLRIFHTRL